MENSDSIPRKSSGVYFTPKFLVDMMVEEINPRLGETVYDPACGIGSFLIGSYRHMEKNVRPSNVSGLERLQHSFFGREINPSTYELAVHNLASNGIDPSGLWLGNSLLKRSQRDPLPKQFDVILCNPPFSAHARPEEQSNFEYSTRYVELLFLQHVIDSLKPSGRAAMILPEGILVRTDREFRNVKQKLLDECSVDRVIRLNDAIAPGLNIKFSVIFFVKGASTRKIKIIQQGEKKQQWITTYESIAQRNFDMTPPDDAVWMDEEPDSSSLPKVSKHRIFISYRHTDSAWATGRLYDFLERRFVNDPIFNDVNSISVGRKFPDVINNALESCDVLIAVIGANWDAGRLQDSSDWVRRELTMALNREIMVIPILLDGTEMPRPEHLPEIVRDLANIHALEMTAKNFRQQVEQLTNIISDTLYPIADE